MHSGLEDRDKLIIFRLGGSYDVTPRICSALPGVDRKYQNTMKRSKTSGLIVCALLASSAKAKDAVTELDIYRSNVMETSSTYLKALKRAVNEIRMSCDDCHYYFWER